MKKKTVALLLTLALVLVVGVAAGGTMAWLLDKTESIINTFTAGDVDITLEETTTTYKMVPGATISKDPKLTVSGTSESCYVFVELTKSNNFDTFMTYAVADGWEAGTGDGESGNGIPKNVYYRTVNAVDTTREFEVLADDIVTVRSDVTKAQLNGVAASNQPTLTVTAYACQLAKTSGENFKVAEAWEQVKTVSGNTGQTNN